MGIAALSQVTVDAKAYMNLNQAFTISRGGDGSLYVQPYAGYSSASHEVNNINTLLNATIPELKSRDLRAIPYADSQELRKIVDFGQKMFKALKRYGTAVLDAEVTPQVLNPLNARLLSAKCGGKIDPQVFIDGGEFRQFIEANALHNQIQALRIQLSPHAPNVATIPIYFENGETKFVKWSKLVKEPVQSAADQAPTGYSFKYKGQEVFRTDLALKMSDEYTLLYNGINHYDALHTPEIRAFEQRNPEDWNRRFYLDVCPMVKDPTGEFPSPCIGDHTFSELRDDKGRVYSIGAYPEPLLSNLGRDDLPVLFGEHQRSTRTPDWYSLYPEDSHNFNKFSFQVTEAQFERLRARYTRDKTDPDGIFSVLKKNCTSYQVNVIKEELGIQLEAKLHLASYVIRQIFPKWLQDGLFGFYNATFGRLPGWLQNVIHFFPPYYIASVIVGGLIKMMGSSRGNRVGTDVSLVDLFFMPWNLYYDHPIALRENLLQLMPQGEMDLTVEAATRSMQPPTATQTAIPAST